MHRSCFTTLITIVVCANLARGDKEAKLADTDERLSADEEKAVRAAVYDNGPSTASRDIKTRPYPRILVIPQGLEAQYETKPKATVRLLLKVVEGGRAWDSIHAVCCIQAVIKSPEFAAITAQGSDDKTWDDVIGEINRNTYREHHRQVCIKLIAEDELGKIGEPKK